MAGTKRARAASASDNESAEDDDRRSKRNNVKSKATASSKITAEDTFFELGNKTKRVTVNSFNGKTLIHIREYYEDKNTEEMKPGKKGIALTMEHYNALLAHIPNINQALRDKGEDVEDAGNSAKIGEIMNAHDNEDELLEKQKKPKTIKANIDATDSESD